MTETIGQPRQTRLYRAQYRHRPTGELAQFHPMSRPGALEIARQLAFDGEEDVRIIALSDGTAWTLAAFSGLRP